MLHDIFFHVFLGAAGLSAFAAFFYLFYISCLEYKRTGHFWSTIGLIVWCTVVMVLGSAAIVLQHLGI